MFTGFLRRSLSRLGFVLFTVTFACAALAAAPAKKNPSWSELTPEQQQILKPLAGEWDTLETSSRTKWLGIAKRYPKMTPTGQKRVQSRMSDWVKLTPDQRRNAREQYRKIGKLPPDKREEFSQQWEEYQQLPDDVKKRLAAEQHRKTVQSAPKQREKAANSAKPPTRPAPPPATALSPTVTKREN